VTFTMMAMSAAAIGAALGLRAGLHVSGFAPAWVRRRFGRDAHARPAVLWAAAPASGALAGCAALVATSAVGLADDAAAAAALAAVALGACVYADAATRRVPLVLLQSFVGFSLLLGAGQDVGRIPGRLGGAVLVVCCFAAVGSISSRLAGRASVYSADLWIAGGLALLLGPAAAAQALVHGAVLGLLLLSVRGTRRPGLWGAAVALGFLQLAAVALGSAAALAGARLCVLGWGALVLRHRGHHACRRRLAFVPMLALGASLHLAGALLGARSLLLLYR
jgi:hypothetical protein